jgi:hypothetical protein
MRRRDPEWEEREEQQEVEAEMDAYEDPSQNNARLVVADWGWEASNADDSDQ